MASERRMGPRAYTIIHSNAWEWLNTHWKHGLCVSRSPARRRCGDKTIEIYFLCQVHNRYLTMEERDFKRDPYAAG